MRLFPKYILVLLSITFLYPSSLLAKSDNVSVRVFASESCLLTPTSEATGQKLGPLLAALVPILVGVAYDGITNAIAEASKEKAFNKKHVSHSYLFYVKNGKTLTFDPRFRCLTVIVGEGIVRKIEHDNPDDGSKSLVETDQIKFSSVTASPLSTNVTEAEVTTALLANNISFESLNYVWEGALLPSDDRTALRLENRLLFTKAPFSTKHRNSERGLAISIDFKAPDGSSYSSIGSPLGKIKRKTKSHIGPDFDKKGAPKRFTRWFPLPIASKQVTAAAENAKSEISQFKATLGLKELELKAVEAKLDGKSSGASEHNDLSQRKQKLEKEITKLNEIVNNQLIRIGENCNIVRDEDVFSARISNCFGPVMLEVTASEVRNANEVGLFFAKLFGAVKKPIVDAASAAIIGGDEFALTTEARKSWVSAINGAIAVAKEEEGSAAHVAACLSFHNALAAAQKKGEDASFSITDASALKAIEDAKSEC